MILVIDDEIDIREAIQNVLESVGYQVSTASNGREALERAVERPELIFLDLMMPVMNGFEFMQAKPEHPSLRETPVVVISADANAEVKAERMNVNGCMRKPLQLDALLAWAQKYCGQPTL